MRCPKCNEPITLEHDYTWCTKCGEPLPEEIKSQLPKLQKSQSEAVHSGQQVITSQPISGQSQKTGAIDMLKVFAWLDLIAGIIGAIWIWSEFGKRISPGFSYVTESNPMGIAIGIAVLLQGIFACAFLLVVAQIAENLIAIRKNTDSKNK